MDSQEPFTTKNFVPCGSEFSLKPPALARAQVSDSDFIAREENCGGEALVAATEAFYKMALEKVVESKRIQHYAAVSHPANRTPASRMDGAEVKEDEGTENSSSSSSSPSSPPSSTSLPVSDWGEVWSDVSISRPSSPSCSLKSATSEEWTMVQHPQTLPPPATVQQRAPPNQPNHPDIDDAISYITTIKKRFADEPEIYKQFLEILRAYQKEQVGIKDVLEQVSTLFADHPDLLKDFTYFLPDAAQEAG
ncbi:hypothetical protein TrCOL_g1202 [Triparma columacea]|uniref:Paired amphipathic helix protein Sin3a n=1 Tax=Triparma columacea TaxID=722753 RepID=A0A9W7G3Z7_9STRA|nr:hypothetical protein TrCOL_g1202 [Triparma columacea]